MFGSEFCDLSLEASWKLSYRTSRVTENAFTRLILYSSGRKTGTDLCHANKIICCDTAGLIKSAFLFRQMQTVMRMEHTLATATEQLERTRSIYNELQAEVTDQCIASL